MLQTFHYSSTIQIDTKIQAQFQEFKYGWLACIDNKNNYWKKQQQFRLIQFFS